jgi:hypothetical protein
MTTTTTTERVFLSRTVCDPETGIILLEKGTEMQYNDVTGEFSYYDVPGDELEEFLESTARHGDLFTISDCKTLEQWLDTMQEGDYVSDDQGQRVECMNMVGGRFCLFDGNGVFEKVTDDIQEVANFLSYVR